MYDSHYEWSQMTTRWVQDLQSDPTDLMSPGRTFEVLNNAGALAQAGHDDLAGVLLRAWNAAVSRRATADAAVAS